MARDVTARARREQWEGSWRTMDDATLVEAMRASDPGAWSEYHARFHPLLDLYGRRIGISVWSLEEYVCTALDDAALRLTDATGFAPRKLAGYLCRVLRNHALMARRAELRRQRHQQEASDVRYGEHAVRSLCSEHALRASEGAGLVIIGDESDGATAGCGRAALAKAMLARLTLDERRLVAWMQDAVPCREVAGWLGITYDAAAKRTVRVKQKLRAVAVECVPMLQEGERRDIARLLPSIFGTASGKAQGDTLKGKTHDK